MLPDPASLAGALREIALRAGREILAVYGSGFTVTGRPTPRRSLKPTSVPSV